MIVWFTGMVVVGQSLFWFSDLHWICFCLLLLTKSSGLFLLPLWTEGSLKLPAVQLDLNADRNMQRFLLLASHFLQEHSSNFRYIKLKCTKQKEIEFTAGLLLNFIIEYQMKIREKLFSLELFLHKLYYSVIPLWSHFPCIEGNCSIINAELMS